MPKPNKKYLSLILIFPLLLAGIFGVAFQKTNASDNLGKTLSGKILLQVENKGEAWYVNTDNQKRYYLGRPSDAFSIMRELGLGVSETDYGKFENSGNKAPVRLAGKILLRVEKKGEAYYISPIDLMMHYLGRPKDAFDVMRNQGLGITNSNLEKIEVGRSIEEVEQNRKEEPVGKTGQEIREERERAQRENDKATCTYANGCEWYKGVMIRWVVDADTFPPEWVVDEDISAEAKPIDSLEVSRAIRIMKTAMDKYPEDFFERTYYLREVYVLGGLKLFHKTIGGSLSIPHKKLFVGLSSYDDVYEQTFHHEYSSHLLWRNYKDFSETEWNSINPKDFEYVKNEYNKMGYNQKTERERGFLENYSHFDITNDFNCIAQQLFKKETKFLDGNFWEIVEGYPKIRQKVDMVIDFYHKLDPMFTEEYFRKVWDE